MIQADNLTKKFHDFIALDQASIHVPRGTVYGLVGPNGAGKTTLLRHVTGIYRADSGSVLVDGEPVYENTAAKSKLAYIPDDLFYFLQANTLDMKRFYAGLYPNFDLKLFDELREFFPAIDVHRRIRRLSKGMQKQVAFWLSLCCCPQALVLDEPVDGLDPVMRRQLWSLLLKWVRQRQTTILVSSHNLRELEDVCDHVGIMHHGKIMLEHSLLDLQGQVIKVQAAFEQALPMIPEDLDLLHLSNAGRVYTMIIRGESRAVQAQLQRLNPVILDILPLTLEEIFIYEMGGADYAVKEILF